MATRIGNKDIALELTTWSKRLHELSCKIDRLPSLDKFKLLPQIEELHIIITEMDDRLCQIVSGDPNSLATEIGQGELPGFRKGGYKKTLPAADPAI